MADQAALPQLTKRELAIERSQRVSRALHDAARKARLSVRGAPRWQGGVSRGARDARSFAVTSALLIFVIPTLLAAIFYGLLASDQFESEAQFSVRARSVEPTDTLGRLTGMPSLQQAQDALVVVDYIRSRAIVEKLDGELGLRAMYDLPNLSFFERNDRAAPIEELLRYWRKKTSIDVEGSGIITLRVRAFRPEDALTIARAVLASSEALINGMSSRSRDDALSSARSEVARAERRLVEIRDELRRVRNAERIIDPKSSLENLNQLMSATRLEQIKLQDEMKVSSRSLSPSSSQMQVMKARLDAVTNQIRLLENQMTSVGPEGDTSALSRSFTAYDKAILDQLSAEKLYQIIAASFEKARMDSSRQQVFLEAFVSPVLPQEAEYPRRIWNTFLVGLSCFGIWFVIGYVHAAMRR